MAPVRRLVVYGWYGRGNVGDELMKQALECMFVLDDVVLKFVDRVDLASLSGASGIIFGGGSILHDDPVVSQDALAAMLSKQVPVFYVGVGLGSEARPSPVHQQLLSLAAVVAFRDKDVPDLVYALSAPPPDPAVVPTGVLWLPNVEVVPTHADVHWMHLSWERFKDEAAQAIDELIDAGLRPTFGLCCSNDRLDDIWPAHELTSRLRRRQPRPSTVYVSDLAGAIGLMRQHQVVVTQRYHGIVLAEMAGVPYVSIAHHDKLKEAILHRGTSLSYHGCTKHQLVSAVVAQASNTLQPRRVDFGVYARLVRDMISTIDGSCHGQR